MPPSIVTGRGQHQRRKQSRVTKKMLPERSIAMKNAHNFQFGSNGFPRESTLDHQPQNVCFNPDRFQQSSRNVFGYADCSHLQFKRVYQRLQNPLFILYLVHIPARDLKQISVMQAIEREWLVQNHYVGEQSRERKDVFVGLESESLGHWANLVEDFPAVCHPAGPEKSSLHAKRLGLSCRADSKT